MRAFKPAPFFFFHAILLAVITATKRRKLKAFGLNLKRIREEKGFTVRSLSYACSIDDSTISKIENGQKNITLMTLDDLARGLEVDPRELIVFQQ